MNRKSLITSVWTSVWAVACLFASSTAFSESKSIREMVSDVKSSCKADVEKYCSDITPGEGRVAACLDSREDQLSEKCRTSWSSTKASISRELDKTEVAFRKSCGSDVKKFCSNVPSGRGRVLSCLEGHKDGLSESCQKFEAKLEEKLSTLMG